MNTTKPILTLMDEFLANQDIRETARKRYRENMHIFISWLTRNAADIRNPKRSEVLQYKEHLIQSGRATTTIDAYLVPVRQFFRWLEGEKIYDNIAAGIRSPIRHISARKRYLSVEQVNQLLSSIDRTTIQGKRNYAFMTLMLNTGMRCVEISRMNLVDIALHKSCYVIAIQGKGHINKDRDLKIPGSLYLPLYDYIAARQDVTGEACQPVFVNHCVNNKRITPLTISKIIKKQLKQIQINDSKYTAHSFRHTAAINALKAGANLVEVKSMLGHKNSRSTDIYLRALEEESAEEGTAVRLLADYYKNNNKTKK